MREGASIMSEDLQQMSDLLLVVELSEDRLKACGGENIKDEPSSSQPSL